MPRSVNSRGSAFSNRTPNGWVTAAAKAEGEAKKVLTMPAQWERDREELFRKYHDQAFQEYAGMPWGG